VAHASVGPRYLSFRLMDKNIKLNANETRIFSKYILCELEFVIDSGVYLLQAQICCNVTLAYILAYQNNIFASILVNRPLGSNCKNVSDRS
jgi:hypothetical protein